MTVKQIIANRGDLSISMSKHVECIPRNSFLYTEEILDEIENARQNTDSRSLEHLLIVASRDGLDNRYTNSLCNLLLENWHHSQEDTAMMLEKIKDPSSIEALYKRAINFLDYDDGRSLSKKCIWALGAIGTEDAKEKLMLLKNMNDPIVSEVATMEINDKFGDAQTR